MATNVKEKFVAKIIEAIGIIIIILKSKLFRDYFKLDNEVIQNIESTGAIFHVALSALPAAIYLFFRRQIRARPGGSRRRVPAHLDRGR